MKIESVPVLGLDVSKHNVTCCVLDKYPPGGLAKYWKATRRNAVGHYPIFYSSPKGNRKSAFDFADWVRGAKPGVACMEPTGNHYSKLWNAILTSLGIPVLWIGHIELKCYRNGKKFPGHSKNDAVDALSMAAYPHDPEKHLENGELDLRHFLTHQPDSINQIRELCQQIHHLARVQSPVINYLRQALAWQFPEAAHVKSCPSKSYASPLYGWLADKPEAISKAGWTRTNNRYQKSIAPTLGIEISDYVRLHGKWMVDIQTMEREIDGRLKELVWRDEFQAYNHIFDKFGFGLRIRARLLSRIYPFESFLLPNGKVWIEHEHRQVKHVQREFKDGKTSVKFQPGDVKRIKRNRSRDGFKMRLGMGTWLDASGDSLTEKPGGSSICRQSLWQHVLVGVETGHLPETEQTSQLMDYCYYLKSQSDRSGKPLLHGKHVQGKLMAKLTNCLFKELVKTFV